MTYEQITNWKADNRKHVLMTLTVNGKKLAEFPVIGVNKDVTSMFAVKQYTDGVLTVEVYNDYGKCFGNADIEFTEEIKSITTDVEVVSD